MGVVFAMCSVGYILGVWTACLVFKQPQRAYEEGAPVVVSSPRVFVLDSTSPIAVSRR
jgi:hypothetical protein